MRHLKAIFVNLGPFAVSVLLGSATLFSCPQTGKAAGARYDGERRKLSDHALTIRKHIEELISKNHFYPGKEVLTKEALGFKMRQMDELAASTHGRVSKELFADHLIEVIQEVDRIERQNPTKKIDAETILFAATILTFIEPLEVLVPRNLVSILIEKPSLLKLAIGDEIISFKNPAKLKEKLIELLATKESPPRLSILDPFLPALFEPIVIESVDLQRITSHVREGLAEIEVVIKNEGSFKYLPIYDKNVKSFRFPLTLSFAERETDRVTETLASRHVKVAEFESVSIHSTDGNQKLTEVTFRDALQLKSFFQRLEDLQNESGLEMTDFTD